MTALVCHVYRSPRRRDTYLYLLARDDFSAVPAPLLASFGPPQHALSFEFTAERKLARADAATVRAALTAQGYYLQLPPPECTVPVPDFMRN